MPTWVAHSPGCAVATWPHRAVSAPMKVTDERIDEASSAGITLFVMRLLSTVIQPHENSVLQPSFSNIINVFLTSDKSGQFVSFVMPPVINVADKIGSIEFLAPSTTISPEIV